jgi:hypothetical protein
MHKQESRHTCTAAQEDIWEVSAAIRDTLLGAQVKGTSE